VEDPPFFYRSRESRLYGHPFLVRGVFAPFRLLHAEPFLAYQLNDRHHEPDGVRLFCDPRKKIFGRLLSWPSWAPWYSRFANSLWVHEGSSQIFGIYFTPPIALIGLAAWRTRHGRPLVSSALGVMLVCSRRCSCFDVLPRLVLDLGGRRDLRTLPRLCTRVMCAEVIAGVKSAWRTIIGVVAGFLLASSRSWSPMSPSYVNWARELWCTLSITLRSGTT